MRRNVQIVVYVPVNARRLAINYKDHRIDYSRCVTCMDCIDSCKHGAISYKYRFGKKEIKETSETGNTNNARRSFLTGMGLVLVSSAVKAQEKKVDGGLAVILDKKVPARTTPLVPPGAKGLRNMRTRCTGCQLCVSVCPNQVLRPSTKLETLMQPEMSYERGYCRPGMYEMFGGMSGRSNLETYPGG